MTWSGCQSPSRMRRPSQAGRVWCVLDLKRGEKGMQWGWGGSTGKLVKYTGRGLISYRCMLSIMGASNSVGEGSYRYWKGENWNKSCKVKIRCINVNSWILKSIDTYIERDITVVKFMHVYLYAYICAYLSSSVKRVGVPGASSTSVAMNLSQAQILAS